MSRLFADERTPARFWVPSKFRRTPIGQMLVCSVLVAVSCWVAQPNGPAGRSKVQAEPPKVTLGAKPDSESSRGSDHVGRPFPDYVTGDECLFCHRTIGTNWPLNPHQLTMRLASPRAASVTALRENVTDGEDERFDFLLGYRKATRFLRRSNAYGKVDMASAIWHVDASAPTRAGSTEPLSLETIDGAEGRLLTSRMVEWDANGFGTRCAGCHATAVDTKTLAFSAISLDCVVCHGVVDLNHSKQAGLVWLGKGKRDGRNVISICGQCHLRGGVAESTGRPYPNTFVPGDNLFRDFKIDLSMGQLEAIPPQQRHLYESARAVVMEGATEQHCLSCHTVHSDSVERHQELPTSSACATCHNLTEGNLSLVDDYQPRQVAEADHNVCDWAADGVKLRAIEQPPHSTQER